MPLLAPDASHEAWLAARRSGIGGSDVAAVIGISKYAGPTRVYYEKLGVLGDEDNESMEWGRRLEDAVRQKFADEHPEFYITKGPGLVAHPERRWQLATIDGLAAECPDGDPVAIVELKTGKAGADDWGDQLTDEVPLPYVCQVTWYLDVYGLTTGYLAVLLDGRDYREYLIEYDVELASKLRGHCSAFWHGNVLASVPPDPDGLESTTDVLASQHNPKAKTKGDLDPNVVGWAQIYGNAHQDELAAQERKREAGNHIRAAFLAAGSPHYGYVGDRKIASFSKSTGGTVAEFDEERFAAEQPDLYAKYLTTRVVDPVRRLTVSKEFTS
ncbi:YqaJ viral recombinase family protein [Micromonospora sp. WMMD1102]|uniref:YqaJ viral recombinase family nuclease n=1 Tax=Micromonospora sp. WMMD1102 TaxID=3016105 RepID=UPI0024150C95|nr:YqaJ viral recombinase family protein [Micromonospora sp. WMMD1102]MDG4791950.1 YqaJ viral recombinase family protein [Micromonospora sp. WMMD1102]